MKRCLGIAGLIITALLASCSSGGGGSGIGGTGRAILGPVIDANVRLFDAFDPFEATLCETTTRDGNSIDNAGVIDIPSNCFSNDELYVIEVTGGEDIDADDDGVRDATSTPVNGSFHAILTGQQITENNWKVTPITDLAYRLVRSLLLSSDREQILQALDQTATVLVTEDLTGDGVIDHRDLAIWHTRLNAASFALGEERLQQLIEQIQIGPQAPPAPGADVTGQLLLPGNANAFVIDGETLWASTSEGVFNVNLSDPQNPVLESSVEVFNLGVDLAVRENQLLIAANDQGLIVFDISDPLFPALSTTFKPDNMVLAGAVTVAGDTTALTSVNTDVRVHVTTLDLSSETVTPIADQAYTGIFDARAIDSDTSIFLRILNLAPDLTVSLQLQAMDISNPEAPRLTDSITLDESIDVEGENEPFDLIFTDQQQLYWTDDNCLNQADILPGEPALIAQPPRCLAIPRPFSISQGMALIKEGTDISVYPINGNDMLGQPLNISSAILQMQIHNGHIITLTRRQGLLIAPLPGAGEP